MTTRNDSPNDRVRLLREAYRMTQAELGALAGTTQVSKIETGKSALTSWDIRARLAKGFGLTIDQLVAYLDGALTIDKAMELGRLRVDMALAKLRDTSDELNEAIEMCGGWDRVGIVVPVARRMAESGVRRTSEEWALIINDLMRIVAEVMHGNPGSGKVKIR